MTLGKVLLVLVLLVATSWTARIFRKRKNTWTQGDFVGPTWQAKSATTKQQQLWQAITTDTRSGTWYSALEQAELLLENMNVTITKVQDEMPKQGPFDLLTRKKLIHTVGAVAQAKFVSVGKHNYTGGFAGSNTTLIRLSLAKPPTDTNTVPGLAMKFLRDKVPSANFFAMYKLEGQNSFNFFENEFVNHVPSLGPDADSVLKALRAKFATASKWPEMIGLNKVSLADSHGNIIQHPVFPFSIRLVPNPEIRHLFPSQKSDKTLEEQLSTLKADTLLYSVYAQADPTVSATEHIADIVITSPFTASQFGDRGLFFEHSTIDEDLAYRPEWRKYLP